MADNVQKEKKKKRKREWRNEGEGKKNAGKDLIRRLKSTTK